ncbi:MAG: DUF1501 domain-containing protein [Bacteroidia bacterium]|nr:DUF1501 domain-containing protein [Bacteroidia bacterium]
MKRREFLEKSALASAMLLLPRFLRGSADLQFGSHARGKVLVVVQLGGGNDGLNTVVPWQNDIYYKLRPGIAHSKGECLRLDDDLALAPGMEGLKGLFDSGNLAIVNGVGYPNPIRSHFRSMDIWQSASPADQYWNDGWIGRLLDANCPDCKPYQAIEVDEGLSLAMKGKTVNGIALTNPQSFYRNVHEPFFHSVANQPQTAVHDHPTLEYLHKTLVETSQSADYIHAQSKIYQSKVEYPQNPFAQHVKLISELIISGSETQIYYVSLTGFDTHAGQKAKQGRLLKLYADTMAAFCSDLKQKGRFQDVTVMTFSEFGRRVAQNASNGTDHGTASNVFLLGGALKKPGIYNPLPSLEDLDEGDLKHSIDFRRVYASLLQDWLGADSTKVLEGRFETLGVV